MMILGTECYIVTRLNRYSDPGCYTVLGSIAQNPAGFQGCAEGIAVFGAHGHERQPKFLLHHVHHGQRGLAPSGIGLDEQILEQTIIFVVQLQRDGRVCPSWQARTRCAISRGMKFDATLMTLARRRP